MSTKYYNISAVGPELRIGKGGPLLQNVGGVLKIDGNTIVTNSTGVPGSSGNLLFNNGLGGFTADVDLSFDSSTNALTLGSLLITATAGGDVTLLTTATNGDLVLDTNGTGQVQVNAATIVTIPTSSTDEMFVVSSSSSDVKISMWNEEDLTPVTGYVSKQIMLSTDNTSSPVSSGYTGTYVSMSSLDDTSEIKLQASSDFNAVSGGWISLTSNTAGAAAIRTYTNGTNVSISDANISNKSVTGVSSTVWAGYSNNSPSEPTGTSVYSSISQTTSGITLAAATAGNDNTIVIDGTNIALNAVNGNLVLDASDAGEVQITSSAKVTLPTTGSFLVSDANDSEYIGVWTSPTGTGVQIQASDYGSSRDYTSIVTLGETATDSNVTIRTGNMLVANEFAFIDLLVNDTDPSSMILTSKNTIIRPGISVGDHSITVTQSNITIGGGTDKPVSVTTAGTGGITISAAGTGDVTLSSTSGHILVNKAPTVDLGVATKKYVDDAVDAAVNGSLDVADLVTLTGVSANSTTLGTFTGATIPDSQTIKAALQSLETAHEEVDQNVNDIITLTGVAENATTLGTFTGSTIADSSTVKAALQALETEVELKIDSAEKGVANGVATLDGSGKVPVSQLPSAIMTYEGVWNASTNTPALIDGTGDAGQVYRVTVAGTQNLGSGNITFAVGDYIIYNSSGVWEKSDTTDSVVSVNGFTGIVVLDTDDVSEGSTNLYFTDTRARTAVVAATITNGDTTHAPSGDAVFDALALKADDSVVDNIVTLTGVAENATDLGTFTGTTIPDSSDIKEALQALETEVETKGDSIGSLRAVSATIAAGNGATNVGSALPDNAIVVSCTVKVTTAYDGTAPTMTVGVTGDLAGIAADTDIELESTGLNFVRSYKDVGVTNKQVIVTIARTSGGGTVGAASVIVEYYVVS